jgi:glycosyltransferase involved in cell wall biosynthesis
MFNAHTVAVIIPAFNEADAIGKVIGDIPGFVDTIIVADNNSTDDTAAIAASLGAVVVHEPEAGYGAACLKGISAAADHQILVFMDGDYADRGEDMHRLIEPIASNQQDLVIGSRTLGEAERGALTPQQRWGNWLACRLIWLFWGKRYTDLGPYRAISAQALAVIDMQDRAFGWTVEMQLKAIDHHFLDAFQARQVKHGVEQDAFHDRAQATRAPVLRSIAFLAMAARRLR